MTTADRQYPESWRWGDSPDHGDTIHGVVTEVRDVETKYGPSIVMEIRSSNHDDTAFSVWCSHAGLRQFVTDLRPGPGDTVQISRLGKEEWESQATGETMTKWLYDGQVLSRAPQQPEAASPEADNGSDDIPF